MGGGSLEPSPGSFAEGVRELFEQQCPYYMAIGMTYNEFWFDHAYKAKYYRQAHDLRLEQKNMELWLQGYYVYTAIADMVPVLNPLSSNPKARDYLKQPIPITQAGKERDDLEKTKEAAAQMIALLNRQMAEEKLKGEKADVRDTD